MQRPTPHHSDDPRGGACFCLRPGTMTGSLMLAVLIAVLAGAFTMPNYLRAQDEAAGGEADAATPEKKRSGKNLPENPFPDRPLVPSGIFEGGAGWLNTSGDITIKDLRGKIVLVDFWTYCCINCMHVLPDLAYLEKKFPEELVVIGVHSAKFETEKDTENIRQAIMRYDIEHPVVNDNRMVIWSKFGTRAWPTLALIDPEGRYCGSISGEGHRELLETLIKKLISYHKAKGTLDTSPVRFKLERESLKPQPLKYPGKLLADEKSDRLYVADTGHNRIVVTTLGGKLVEVIGSGQEGYQDGDYNTARFNHPNGMELIGDTLYIADTENHTIRTVDLKEKKVGTLAGTGKQARRRVSAGKLRDIALNSPWALQHHDGNLYICMAGPHQIWKHRLGSETIGVYAGSGLEDIVDGPLDTAAMAQPSGICTDGRFLYVVDSEGSSIRRIPTDARKEMTTIIGPSDLPQGRLFAFGDIDGVGTKARLQHPIGITIAGETLYVADSYNHRIKKVTFTEEGARVDAWIGTGQRGNGTDPIEFHEPEGVSAAAGKLFIADTNNHRIVAADLASGESEVLTIEGLKPPVKPEADDEPVAVAAGKPSLEVAAQSVASGEQLQFEITPQLPEGFKLNKLFPARYSLEGSDGQKLLAADQLKGRHKAEMEDGTIRFALPLAAPTGSAVLEVAVSYGYCRDGVGGLCKISTARWKIPVEVNATAKARAVKLTASPE